MRKLVTGVREGVVREGRHPDDIKVFMGITVIVAPTTKEAQEKYQEYKRYASPEAGLAHFSSGTGIDFSKYELDEPIRQVKTVTNPELNWTKRKLLQQLELGGRYLTIVGSPQEVADELEAWIRETDIDGFNLTRTVTSESYEDFIDLVILELQTRGSYKHEYAAGSLREKLFRADAHLPPQHVGASYRVDPQVEQSRRHA